MSIEKLDLEGIYSYYKRIEDDQLSFIYQGQFSEAMTERIISMSEFNLESLDEFSKMKKKISFLMAESFQNVIRHGGDVVVKEKTENRGMFWVRKNGKIFTIVSANFIHNDQIEYLDTKLKEINQLEPIELKKLYLEILSNSELSQKGGAGLGLIEMARRSGHSLQYSFEKYNDRLSYFYLGVVLNKNEQPLGIDNLNQVQGMHGEMRDENILVSYKGDFAHSSIMPILKMIEENMVRNSEKTTLRRKVFLSLIELAQNIAIHGVKKDGISEGILLLTKKNNRYSINAGNIVHTSQEKTLKKYLGELNEMNAEQLVTLYKKILVEGSELSSTGGGLGLLEVKRDSSNLNYTFLPLDSEKSFFLIQSIITE